MLPDPLCGFSRRVQSAQVVSLSKYSKVGAHFVARTRARRGYLADFLRAPTLLKPLFTLTQAIKKNYEPGLRVTDKAACDKLAPFSAVCILCQRGRRYFFCIARLSEFMFSRQWWIIRVPISCWLSGNSNEKFSKFN